jgi:hypothetical protein
VFALALVLEAAATTPWASTAATFTALGLGAMVAGFGLAFALPRILFRGPANDSPAAWQVAFTLLVLGWGPLMAAQLANVAPLADLRLSAAAGSVIALVVPPSGVALVTLAQVGLIALATAFAAFTMARIRIHATADGASLRSSGWIAVHLLCTTYVAIALWLVV